MLCICIICVINTINTGENVIIIAIALNVMITALAHLHSQVTREARTVWCGTMRCSAVLCSVVLCSVVLCCVVLCCVV